MILFEFLLHHYTYFVAGISRYDTCIPKYLAIDEEWFYYGSKKDIIRSHCDAYESFY